MVVVRLDITGSGLSLTIAEDVTATVGATDINGVDSVATIINGSITFALDVFVPFSCVVSSLADMGSELVSNLFTVVGIMLVVTDSISCAISTERYAS